MSTAQVEILLPEFWDPSSGPVFAEEGDQQRFWKLTRRFIESLAEGSNSKSTKAVSLQINDGILALQAQNLCQSADKIVDSIASGTTAVCELNAC